MAATYFTSSGVVTSGRAFFLGLVLTAGSDQATVTIHKGVNSSASKLLTVKATANTTRQHKPPCAIELDSGMCVVLSGTGPELTIYWQPGSIKQV